jgi:HSP20 family molecular chaperone IbpA
MTQDSAIGEVPRSTVAPAPHGRASNPILNFLRAIAEVFRNLAAELVAFPIVIRRTREDMKVMADLPGIRKDEVKVEVTDTVLMIYVEPRHRAEGAALRAGRRMIPVPEGVDIEKAKAELHKGILTVTLPTPVNRKYRHLPVEWIEYEPPVTGS